MKKVFACALSLVMVVTFLLAGCGGSPSSSVPTQSGTPTADKFEWPKQPVNIMCPAAAGGGSDMILRVINEYFTKKTGQSFVISNVTGLTGYEQVHQGNTDGYDFIFGTTTIFTSKVDGSLSYDWSDYTMVAFVEGSYSTCIAVQADSPYQNINDLLNAAKANPDKVTGGITLSGQPYMFAKAFKKAVGVDLYYVDCGTTAERNASLLGGQVDYIITNVSSSQAYVDSGDFRIIAIDGTERNELSPDIPTFIEQGVDFCFVAQPTVWLAPKGTSAEACEAFNAILAEIYSDPAFIKAMRDIQVIANSIPSVEQSNKMAKETADALAPFVA